MAPRAHVVCFGASDQAEARAWATRVFPEVGETTTTTLTRTKPAETSDGTYRWRGDHKSARECRKMVEAVCAEVLRTSTTRVVVVCAKLGGTGTTRATQTFAAFRSALPKGVDVGIALARGAAPTKASCLRANLLFNAVVARCPARRLYPSRRARSGEEDEDEEERASRTWHREHARAIAIIADRVEDDGDVLIARARERLVIDGDPIQRLTLSMAEQLADVSDAVRAFVETRGFNVTLREGVTARLKASTPERWCSGGYSAHHYVAAPPQPHGVYYELELTDFGVAVGYVAMSALQSDETATVAYPFSSPDTVFTTAQVDRLCVLPEFRGAGVKEALLRHVCDGYHEFGLPVRIKTAKESVVASFEKCCLLAFERVKDPTAKGVEKRRGLKKVVVLPKTDEDRWTVDGDDSRDYDSDWRKLQATTTTTVSNPVAAFNAALNRSTPDTAPRATRQMLTAIEGVSVFDAYAERIVTTAVCQKSYAAMYATLSDAMPFRDDICRRVIALLDSSDDETIAGAAEFLTELWRVGAATEEEFLSGIFREGSLDEFVRVEIAFNALLRFGDVLRDAEPARAYVAACAPDGRRNLSARGAAARLIFLAEEVHAFVESGYSVANRRHFGARPATSRADAHDSAREELKSLRIVYDDGGAETAAILRGERKGWVFWYVGSPVRSHALDGPRAFRFVAEDPRRFVPV